jgi:hypothetical protein
MPCVVDIFDTGSPFGSRVASDIFFYDPYNHFSPAPLEAKSRASSAEGTAGRKVEKKEE